MHSERFKNMKIAENRSERKESTKERQGEVFFGMMGFCRKTMDDYRPFSKDYEKTMTIMEDNGRSSMIIRRLSFGKWF